MIIILNKMVNDRLNKPKVLIISHNSLSDTRNNGKTLLSFFSSWDDEHIAQIYKTNEWPNTKKCKSFYRITDFDVFKAF